MRKSQVFLETKTKSNHKKFKGDSAIVSIIDEIPNNFNNIVCFYPKSDLKIKTLEKNSLTTKTNKKRG